MHIVFGGAFNGKREYVSGRVSQRAAWFEGVLPDPSAPATVTSGLEQWVRRELGSGKGEPVILREVAGALGRQADGLHIWILTDISRGLVPTDALDRQWRDTTGRVYQFLFQEAESVTRIWYGLPENLKGDGWDETLHENRG